MDDPAEASKAGVPILMKQLWDGGEIA